MVTDATTREPIVGATVFVYWGHTVGPTWRGNYWWRCDGTAVATTDVRGHYRLVLPFRVGLMPQEDRTPRMRVVAFGYYDDRINLPFSGDDTEWGRILRTLSWRKHKTSEYLWSPGLLPFAQATIDAKLVTLQQAFPDLEFTGAVAPEFAACQRSGAYREYASAVASVFDRTLCPTSGAELPSPRADVVRAYPFNVWPRYATEWPDTSGDWRKFVEALLPAEPGARASPLVLHNACSVTHPLVPNAALPDYFGKPSLP